MARLRSATVTVLVSVVMRVSCWNGADTAAPRDATLVPPDRRRRDELVSLRLAGRLRLLGRKAQDRVGLAAEGGKVDLPAVAPCAPVPHDRRHGDRLANFLLRPAVRLCAAGWERARGR